jgi:hypothetical protein
MLSEAQALPEDPAQLRETALVEALGGRAEPMAVKAGELMLELGNP